MPSPIRSSGTKTISAPASASSPPSRTTRPGEQREQSAAHDEPRRDVRPEPRDADRGGEQGDRQRQDAHAGRERREAEADREVERDDEEEARLHEVLEEEHDQPAAELAVAQHLRADQRLLPLDSRRASQRKNSPDHEQADRGSARSSARGRTTTARPASAGSSPRRSSGARRRRATPRPAADSTAPTTSSCGRCSAGASAILRGRTRMIDDDDDLAREHPAPREVRRAEAADQRPDRDRDRRPRRRRGRTRPVGAPGGSCRRRARRSPAGSAPRRRPRGTTSRSAGRSGSAPATSNDPAP